MDATDTPLQTSIVSATPPIQIVQFDTEQLKLLRATIAKDTSPQQFDLFIQTCLKTGLDPFTRQIYAVVYKGVMSIQVSIDGMRLVAIRTNEYRGSDGPYWCGEDGIWKDVWLKKGEHPLAAKMSVYRTDFEKPTTRTVLWSEFAGSSPFWTKMPVHMLGKVAESHALRGAFPNELSGLYSSEEMDQAGPQQGVVSITTGDHAETPRDRFIRRSKELNVYEPARLRPILGLGEGENAFSLWKKTEGNTWEKALELVEAACAQKEDDDLLKTANDIISEIVTQDGEILLAPKTTHQSKK